MSDTNISVGVVLPYGAWNRFLPASLGGLKQQCVNLELALFDASDDARVENMVQKSDVALTYHHRGKDDGQAAAIAKGWQSLNTDILGWLNVDDMLTSDALEQIMMVFKDHPDIDVVYGRSLIQNGDGVVIGQFPETERQISDIIMTNMISQPSCFVRRRAVERIGGLNSGLQYTMDWDLWLRLYEAGCKFKYIDRYFSLVTWDRGTKSSGLPKLRRQEVARILRERNPPRQRALTKFGFFLHYISQYSSISPVLSRLRISHTRPNMFFTPTFLAITPKLRLPLINVSDQPMSTINLLFKGDDKNTVVCELEGSQVTGHGRSQRLVLETAVLPGDTAYVICHCEQGANLALESAFFC